MTVAVDSEDDEAEGRDVAAAATRAAVLGVELEDIMHVRQVAQGVLEGPARGRQQESRSDFSFRKQRFCLFVDVAVQALAVFVFIERSPRVRTLLFARI